MDSDGLASIDTITLMKFEPAGAFCDILGEECSAGQPVIVLGSPSEVGRGVVFLRLSNVDRAAHYLSVVGSDDGAVEAENIDVTLPNDVKYCTFCHASVRPADEALRFTRTEVDEPVPLVVGHHTVDKHVWCHKECGSELAAVLRTVWNNTDDIIGEAL